MIGGKFGPFSTSGGVDPWIRILNCKGGGAGVGANAFFEGIDMDSSAAQMDGFQWGGCERWVTPNNDANTKLYDPADPYGPIGSRIKYYADSLYIQNCRITGMHGTAPGYHADWFHNDGALTNIRVDRCDFQSTYQGFFCRENATANNGRDKCPILGEIELRNVFGNRIYHPEMTDEEQTSFFYCAANKDEFDNINRCQKYIYWNVWFNDPENSLPERLWRTSSIVSVSSQFDSFTGRTETILSWPSYGNRIQAPDGSPAKIYIGVPPANVTPGGVAGSMLDPNHMPGLNYVSPGYKGA
jgi:hypothetical protein